MSHAHSNNSAAPSVGASPETAGPAKVVAAVATGSLPEISPLANAASAAAAKIVHHPRWPRMAADAHALAMKIIVAEMETMLREAWKTPSVLRTHVLRYGPPGYDIYDAAEIARVLGEVPREENAALCEAADSGRPNCPQPSPAAFASASGSDASKAHKHGLK